MKKVDILGVKIDDISLDEAVKQVKEWLKRGGKHYIVTPNPEFVMVARKDGEFRRILNQADLAIPDGAGLKLSGRIKNTTPGVDLMEKLVEYAAGYGLTVGFLGGREGVAKEAAECLREKHPSLRIVFASSGPEINYKGNQIDEVDLRFKIYDLRFRKSYLVNRKSFPSIDLLFVAFGQIKQEKWIAKNLPFLPIKIAMGVGGAFDYLSGRVPRAPKWMRILGLEWLFRLAVQPWRIKRQLVLLKFVWRVARKMW